jgi:tight adherence protein C
MDALIDLATRFGIGVNALLTVLVFVPAATMAFLVMGRLRLRGAVRRRAAGISADGPEVSAGSMRVSGMKAAQRLIERTAKHYASMEGKDTKMLRQRLIHAGIFDPRAVGVFFLVRVGAAVGLGVLALILVPTLVSDSPRLIWGLAGVGGVGGYLAPSLMLDRIINRRRQQYRAGFPDFMDLLVVCADAGLSMEAALERVGRELVDSYPHLAANIHMTNLEVRAGRAISEALEHFGDRLGLDEVRAFATLIQQSQELGSSITDALRVYSEDMRHKRLSRAEEKAYALPAKLTIPLMACVFPVLFVVILLPVIVQLKMGAY